MDKDFRSQLRGWALGIIGAVATSVSGGVWYVSSYVSPLGAVEQVNARQDQELAAQTLMLGTAGNRVTALETAVPDLRASLTRIEDKLDRLIERRFGSADPGPIWSSPGILNQRADGGTP